MANKKWDLAQGVQGLTLLDMGMKIEDVRRITGFSQSALYNLKKQALQRGYDPTVTLMIYNVYVEDAHKSRRPGISLKKHLEIIVKVPLY